jgi:putative tRNA adenosine deaminase-associated protein
VDGDEDPRVFLSDVVAISASTYRSMLELPETEDDADLPAGGCGGDFDVLADLGTSPEELRELCEEETVPMDALAVVAEAGGFAEVLDSLR